MSISEQYIAELSQILKEAINEVKLVSLSLPAKDAQEYFALAMINLGFNKKQMLEVITSDKELIALFSEQTIH